LKKFKIKYIPIDDLNPAPYNPRQISREEMVKLTKSINEYGFVDPVIVNNRTGNIVGGHQRVEAAKFLDLKEIPIIEVDLDPVMEKAFNLALNKISGEWDLPKLKDILGELDLGDFDIELTGFDEIEVERLMTSIELDPPDEDEKDREPTEIQCKCPECGHKFSMVK